MPPHQACCPQACGPLVCCPLTCRFRPSSCTARTQYRKFGKKIPRKGIVRSQYQFPHSCVCERFIYSQDRSTYSATGKCVDRLGNTLYKSLTHTWIWKWYWGRAILFLGINKWDFRCSVVQLSQSPCLYHTCLLESQRQACLLPACRQPNMSMPSLTNMKCPTCRPSTECPPACCPLACSSQACCLSQHATPLPAHAPLPWHAALWGMLPPSM